MCKNAGKILSFVIMYVSDRYKTQEMCDKVILEDGGMLKFIRDRSFPIKKCVTELLIIILM